MNSLCLALFTSSVLAADPMHVIIFAGGVTEADGAAALASFKKLENTIAQAVKLPAGEPKVVDSATLAGLKPGFRVVTLGVCKTPGPALAALKAIYPGVYSKQLTEAVPERCPTLTETAAAPFDPAVKVGPLVINAFTLTEPSTDDRGRDTSSSTVGFVLVEKSTGLVKAIETTDGDSASASGDGPGGREYEECSTVVTAEKAGFLIARNCTDERTGCNGGERAIPKRWSETIRVTAKGDSIVLSNPKKSVSEKSPCTAGGSEGD